LNTPDIPARSREYDLGMLESARSGDLAAIEALLARAQPDIRRYARLKCGAAADAEDAVQHTLIRVYQKLDGLRMLSSFSGWLLAIVRRECLRLARMGFGRVSLEEAELEHRLAWLPMDELRRDLSLSMQSLPDAYREIVLLRDVEMLTIDEIAARLSCTREAVKARLHRARKLMREYLRL
jgi:RNA polymerase sigma factor (sigma-70 family)